jgi:hypothetical protein
LQTIALFTIWTRVLLNNMILKGKIEFSCWSGFSIEMGNGFRIVMHSLPKDFKKGDEVVVSIKEENGSALWDMEHYNKYVHINL